MLHAGGSLAATGLIEQLRLTVPIKAFEGVTVIGTVLPVVAPRAMLIIVLPPLTTNVGARVTETELVPDVPL